MKKVILLALVAVVSLSALAQDDKAAQAVLKKVERSDAAASDPKKASKMNTWLDRATAYTDAGVFYTSNLIANIPVAQMTATSMVGEPEKIEEVTLIDVPYSKYVYKEFDMYVTGDGNVALWVVKEEVVPGALKEAIESLKKAKDLDESGFVKSTKANGVVDRVASEFNTMGRNFYMVGDFVEAGDSFISAYNVMELKGVVDTVSYYFAGIALFEGAQYERSEAIFEKLISIGAYQGGMSYYYLASCQDQLGDKEGMLKTYEEAFAKFPENATIMGGLINAYVIMDKNPEEIITLLQNAQKLDPNNVSLYIVEAQIWDKAGKREEAFKALDKAIELDPKSIPARYNYAIFKIIESDATVEAANKLDINDTKTYDEMMAKVEVLRTEAIGKLEECYAIAPDNADVIDLLRQMYFVCRDYEQYKDKHEEFNATHPGN